MEPTAPLSRHNPHDARSSGSGLGAAPWSKFALQRQPSVRQAALEQLPTPMLFTTGSFRACASGSRTANNGVHQLSLRARKIMFASKAALCATGRARTAADNQCRSRQAPSEHARPVLGQRTMVVIETNSVYVRRYSVRNVRPHNARSAYCSVDLAKQSERAGTSRARLAVPS